MWIKEECLSRRHKLSILKWNFPDRDQNDLIIIRSIEIVQTYMYFTLLMRCCVIYKVLVKTGLLNSETLVHFVKFHLTNYYGCLFPKNTVYYGIVALTASGYTGKEVIFVFSLVAAPLRHETVSCFTSWLHVLKFEIDKRFIEIVLMDLINIMQ